MNPKQISKWEIAGVSAYPLVEAMFALELPARLGLTTEAFVSVLAGLMTLLAIVRAARDAKQAP